jgi:outer membrane protein assembly factor BamA
VKPVSALLLFISLLPLNAQIDLEILYNRSSGYEMPFDTPARLDDSIAIRFFLRDLIGRLHDRSFLEASVDSIVYSQDRARAYLHTGNRYSLVKVSLERVDPELLRSLNIRARRYERHPLEVAVFRDLQERLLEYHENSGYPFASASLTNLEISHDTISGSLLIEKNRRYIIDSIHIYGNDAVSRKHLYRHIGIRPGDPYNEYRFRQAGILLRETPFLTELREPEIEFMQRTADLYLYIDPGQASRFSGILGILPGDALTRTRLAGEIDLALVNVFRRMESISLNWQSPGNQVQQFDLELGQPWLFGRPFGADFNLHMFRQDTTYLTVSAEAGILFTLPARSTIRVFGKTLGTSLVARAGEPVAGLTAAADISGRIFGVSYGHNRISNRLNPFRGREISFSAGAGNKKVILPPGYDTGEKERITGAAEGMATVKWFLPVTGSTTLMLANFSGIRLNPGAGREHDYFFVNELFLLGGLHTIRGFDERSIAASSYAIQRIEYRYLFDDSGNIFLFFDGMAYRQKLPERTISDTPFGFGAGMAFGTRAGQFSISYALGRQHGNPVSFRSAKVHMGVISRF